jgi:hypothetical protein
LRSFRHPITDYNEEKKRNFNFSLQLNHLC